MPAASPIANAEGVLRVSLSSDGQPLADSVQLVRLDIDRAINRIPSARLELVDGDMPRQDFPLSDGSLFKPGALIKISAGYGDEESVIFEGLVIKHTLRIVGDNDARLLVECRDKAVRMTVGRKCANYIDKTDSALLATLIQAHQLTAEVQSTAFSHKELVQYYCSDWDFLLARAEANGLLVIASDGTLSVKPPQTSGEAVLSITYGIDLIAFQAELDARHQYAAAQACAWDPKNQSVVQSSSAAPPSLNEQGNLNQATLAEVLGLASFQLLTDTPMDKQQLDAWAKSQQQKSALARIRGEMSFQGSALAKVGALVELKGVGTRFAGTVYLTGLRHRIENGDWTTDAHFGLAPHWFTEQADVLAPPAAGLLPAIEGLHTGVVLKLDGDPLGEHRIQVKVPVLQAETEGVWARLLQPHGSNSFGTFFLPEVGDEVVLGYFNHDPSYPVVLGSLYSSKHPPPYALAAANDTKAIVTRCKHKLEFDEKDKIITITTPANNKIVLSDKDKSILLQDQNDNKVELSPAGISLTSPKDIKLSAKGTMTLDAVGALSLSSKADVKTAGLNINNDAQVGFVAKGAASAELSAAGQTTVKGAMVMIN